ncbi:hypothetical protein [Candidatus Hydrogenosomobacter endosymbioticus]|uniref:Uncharacterized protein n=1 Tax=Candidatus Hydrogenosomobacter endosymbioticus TaxID=2558174 RepID=A0ABM7V868_9PROT|nr:hypothetical protein [Candidatus Hydrogenosomobacter endosymbioticus]BDB95955.1 hypothetical protein HYD_0880 [Candidatus Hydrogenosomobacter endosymbioticus]
MGALKKKFVLAAILGVMCFDSCSYAMKNGGKKSGKKSGKQDGGNLQKKVTVAREFYKNIEGPAFLEGGNPINGDGSFGGHGSNAEEELFDELPFRSGSADNMELVQPEADLHKDSEQQMKSQNLSGQGDGLVSIGWPGELKGRDELIDSVGQSNQNKVCNDRLFMSEAIPLSAKIHDVSHKAQSTLLPSRESFIFQKAEENKRTREINLTLKNLIETCDQEKDRANLLEKELDEKNQEILELYQKNSSLDQEKVVIEQELERYKDINKTIINVANDGECQMEGLKKSVYEMREELVRKGREVLCLTDLIQQKELEKALFSKQINEQNLHICALNEKLAEFNMKNYSVDRRKFTKVDPKSNGIRWKGEEILSVQGQLDTALVAKDQLESALLEKDQLLEAALVAKDQLEAELSEKNQQLESALLEKDQLESALLEKDQRLESALLEKDQRLESALLANKRLESESSEKQQLESESSEKQQQLETVLAKVQQLESESSEKQQQLETVLAKVQQLESELSEKQQQLDYSFLELNSYKERCEKLIAENTLKEQYVITSDFELNHLRKEKEELKGEISLLKMIKNLGDDSPEKGVEGVEGVKIAVKRRSSDGAISRESNFDRKSDNFGE